MSSGDYASVGLVSFLFGVFCAYWAQTTGRDPTAWFFFGFILSPIAGIVLLIENRKDALQAADSGDQQPVLQA